MIFLGYLRSIFIIVWLYFIDLSYSLINQRILSLLGPVKNWFCLSVNISPTILALTIEFLRMRKKEHF